MLTWRMSAFRGRVAFDAKIATAGWSALCTDVHKAEKQASEAVSRLAGIWGELPFI